MSDEPNVGEILIGIFVILFGLCIALVGGGCTVFILGSLNGTDWQAMSFFLLLSLGVLALGLLLARVGFKLLTGRYRK
jgi:hypothetical protein